MFFTLVIWLRLQATRFALAEETSRPEALREAKLVLHGETVSISRPVGLVAKLDRAYRTPSGVIVLVEFKTRWINQPLLSDVIQLSAQRMAVMGQTGQVVAPYGYVTVKLPTRRALPTAHRGTDVRRTGCCSGQAQGRNSRWTCSASSVLGIEKVRCVCVPGVLPLSRQMNRSANCRGVF